jgi:hypothetical protein
MTRSILALIAVGLCAAGVLLADLAADTPSTDTPPSKAVPPVARKKPVPKYSSVLIENVPHVKQKPDFCGEACAEMYLSRLGYPINQDDVFDQSDVAAESGRGCYTADLWKSLRRIGFDVGPVWFTVTADKADEELEALFRSLHADLAAGVPSIACMHYDDQPDTTEHFRLILGYDSKADEVLYHEPAARNGAYRRMSREMLLKLWPLKYEEDRWTIIRMRLKPVSIRNVHSTAKFTKADYAQRVLRVKSKVPEDEDFAIVIQKPFVVVGNDSRALVQRRAQGTVQWAVDRLKRDYFTEDPDKILAIWLFKDKESYDKYTEEIFDDAPDTPFGYVSYKHNAMIMNIATGGGTLVHEIVHPFIASNFPQCPSWFNEGLASLYEQSGDNGGQIWGYTNWRLKGLQKAIKNQYKKPEEETDEDADAEGADDGEEEPEEEPVMMPTFRELCQTTTRQFYYHDAGTNYAQARYLLYYLQQRGLLRKYYHQFRKNVRQDPSGYETLKQILGIENEAGLVKFQKDWEAWVLRLRF